MGSSLYPNIEEVKTHYISPKRKKVQDISDSGEGITDDILGCTGYSSPGVPGPRSKN
jgi:hypothetical protein